MRREARLLSGIILIKVPTIQYGGYFLLISLMIRAADIETIPAAKLLSCWTRQRRSNCDSFHGLPMLADAAVLAAPLVWLGSGSKCRLSVTHTLDID
jgi:hypothetical protein